MAGGLRAVENAQERVHGQDGVGPRECLRERWWQLGDVLFDVATEFVEESGKVLRHGTEG